MAESDDRDAPPGDDRDPMDPAAWYDAPSVCGSCIAWRPSDPKDGETVASGECRLRPELGRVPATLRLCDLYKPRGQYVYQPSPAPSERRRRSGAVRVVRRTEGGELAPAVSAPPPPMPRPSAPVPRNIDLGEDESLPVFRQALIELVREELGRSRRELHPRFRGGRATVISGDGTRKVETSTEQVFAVLDRLKSSLDAIGRQVEERLEGEALSSAQDNLRRAAGSLTTLNVLFAHREDYFGG